MTENDATRAVVKMFARLGVTKPPEVIAALVEEVLGASCESCALAVLGQASRSDGKVLNVPGFLDAYRRTYAAPEHQFHIGQNPKQVDVGKLEARWKREDVRALVNAGMDPTRAQVAAAIRWANGTCAVGEDLDLTAWGRHLPKTITERTITAAWDYARSCATKDPALISDDEWHAALMPWQHAWKEAMGL